MKLFLDSRLKDDFDLRFLKTNFRKDNVNKGKFGIGMILAFWHFFSKLLYQLIFHRPDLVYYPITPTAIGWIGRDALTLIFCRFFRVKSVIHMRGSHFRLNFETFSPWIQRLIVFATCNVSVGLVQADYLHQEFSMLLPPERIKTLYQAIDTENFPYRHESDNSTRTNKVLFVGHLTQAKGYCDLLHAIPLVLQRFPDTVFEVAGNMRRGERGVFFNQYDGSPLTYEDPFEAEKKLLEQVPPTNYRNLGIITGTDKMRHFREATIFVMPSYSEGFSRALLEALSMGKAIVYTPVGAHREIMNDGENGIMVLPGDVKSLANGIVELLGDSERRMRMGKINADYAREVFDIDRIATELGTVFQNTVRGN